MAYRQIDYIENTPPRTSVPKQLFIGTNESEGNLRLLLTGEWSEYKAEEVKRIMAGLQTYLDMLLTWDCPKCGRESTAVPQTREHGPTWVRCEHCKKKTERERLNFRKRGEAAEHI